MAPERPAEGADGLALQALLRQWAQANEVALWMALRVLDFQHVGLSLDPVISGAVAWQRVANREEPCP